MKPLEELGQPDPIESRYFKGQPYTTKSRANWMYFVLRKSDESIVPGVRLTKGRAIELMNYLDGLVEEKC